MNQDQMLDEIRDANLSYLLLAQRMIREDRAQAMFRLGVSEQVADIVGNLSMAQVIKIASTNMLMCSFRFGEDMVWGLLTSHSKDAEISRMHAALLMAGAPAAEAAVA
jgi:Flagellar transcriptional activator (FlhD).